MNHRKIEDPLAIFLTHRRGAGVAVVNNLGDYLHNLPHLNSNDSMATEQTRERIHSSGIALLTQATTSEALVPLYEYALKSCNLTDKIVKTLAFVRGPGSFTGLRMGCAFVNGLTAAHPRELWSVPCLDVNAVKQWLPMGAECDDELADFSGLRNVSDPSQANLAWADIAVALNLLHLRFRCEHHTTAHPEYGREPGPVLKLRERMAGRKE